MSHKAQQKETPFAEAALTLNHDLVELDRLAQSLEGLNVDSDKGLDRAQQLLQEFDGCRQRIGGGMAHLGRILEEVRQRIESTTEAVARKACNVHDRMRLTDEFILRYRALGESVRDATSSAGELGALLSAPAVESEPALHDKLENLRGVSDHLTATACKLQEDAHAANLKTLERSVDSLRQRLETSSKRLVTFAAARLGGNHGDAADQGATVH